MALIKCPECGKEISDKAASCPHCGCPVSHPQTQVEKTVIQDNLPNTKPKKKGHGCLISFVVILLIFCAMFSATVLNVKPVEVVFDASRFYITEDDAMRPMHEAEVTALLGEPESIDEWNYESVGLQYPIRSLIYDDGNYVYEFCNDYLVRIQIFEPFPYDSKKDFLKMFNLSRYSNTQVTVDNNVSYRVSNCGVVDFWLIDITENEIKTTYLTYLSGIFGD